ncbi:xanthine dehydrogenase family protein molybdopterin-binding subunit [Limimaricola sp. G21655-S1]|uniref:xanthine dehydrogenase family protein molybdopterin-binding subunit n=1 Tax=Limimaricola sp. G21655-S1 TaxID=3014768 RepID=UPI0022AF3239|nr:xanthine dehydrogenase family protein molybdopterin-binding subunit [Limimaricola sp. G21655-S1]MCZ4259284.1 xanthine dehydrogenase family protein molybdopterin-binding subunit [Limimaricola sp. G21655-S1]
MTLETTRRLKHDTPDTDRRLDGMAQGVLGTGMDRPEGPLKVSGRATYAAEAHPEAMAEGYLVRATTIGRITGSNADAIRAMPGVIEVIEDERMIRNAAQGMAGESPVQRQGQVWYVGQPVACVVAESFEQARHAAQAMMVTIEPDGTHVFDAEDPAAEVEKPEQKQLDQGDLEGAMSAATFSLDATYHTPSMSSAAMEPHASIAQWDEDGVLTLRGSYQLLKFNKAELADVLGVAPDKVRILSPYVGGGFGSKLGLAPEAVAAALAAQALGRPVRVVLHRRQVFETVTRRSETRQRIRLACDAEGKLSAIGHENLVSQLPGEVFSEPVAQGTHFQYAAPNRVIGHEIARIRRPAAGSVRAPGEAVGVTAFEIAIDELAKKAGIDPLEFRLRNVPDKHPENGKPFSSSTMEATLREGAKRFGWTHTPPRQRREGEWWIGTGMAGAVRVNMMIEAMARAVLTGQGVRVECDMTDIGTGSYAILTQVAAEMLGFAPDRVETVLGDTDLPPASGSGGSFGAASTSTAVYLACMELRERLAAKLGVKEPELTLKDGLAIHENRQTPLAEILGEEEWRALGHLQPGKAGQEVRQATWGAIFAEVAVSDVTGETRVRRMDGTFAAGRILNLKTARSQCHGGMTWGIGLALTEAMEHDPRDGHMVNRDLAEYHLPVNLDVPQLGVHFLEERDDWANPLQAKGIGELSVCGSGAAVINAIENACGVRVRRLPATLDQVMDGLIAQG